VVTQQLKFEEGLRLKPYLCTKGHKTIGYGHNLDAHPGEEIPEQITQEQAEVLLALDIQTTQKQISKQWMSFSLLDEVRQAACLNMAFQLGIDTFLSFNKMRRALARFDWELAHKEALDSQWAQQTPERAARVAKQFITGRYYVIPVA